jgi:hypothetical protein
MTRKDTETSSEKSSRDGEAGEAVPPRRQGADIDVENIFHCSGSQPKVSQEFFIVF